MSSALLRKARALAADPVLRRWLGARLLRRTPGAPAFTPHRPPSLGEGWAGLSAEDPTASFPPLAPGAPERPIRLRLPGLDLDLAPGEEAGLFDRPLADLETYLGLHRFAWVPRMAADDDPRWVGAIWRLWCARHGIPDSSWVWHPYTAAERAIALLGFAARHGLPGPAADSAALLAAHAPAIAATLEYFGEHHTSNHLFNNARGLYLLGVELGLPRAEAAGAALLRAEIRRIFHPSGLLREASSHYHLLLTRSLASLWLGATAHHRPEAALFEEALRAALGPLGLFDLPGGLPLVGDISPDCPPEFLTCLLPSGDRAAGWMATLPEARRQRLAALLAEPHAVPAAGLDGWLRADHGPWSGLWHAEPEGWSPMPGHGHQDCGSFVLHVGGEPLFVDCGRGSYAEAGEADRFVSAAAHNGISVDGADPYPPNRPYYAPAFRRAVAGGAVLDGADSGVALAFEGFARLPGVGMAERIWRLGDAAMILTDRLDGRGRRRITRRLFTPCAVGPDGPAGLILTTPRGRRLRLTAGGAPLSVAPDRQWLAYGESRPVTRIEISESAALPWTGRLMAETL